MTPSIRTATLDDRQTIDGIIAESSRGLSQQDYTAEQIEAALGTAWGTDTQLIRDGTYFVVAMFQNDGTNNDSISLWINPTLTGLGTADVVLDAASAGAATNFYVSGNPGYAIQGVVLDFKSSGASAGSTSVDEIRIGTTLADLGVVPEPSAGLLLIAATGLLGIRRRRA